MPEPCRGQAEIYGLSVFWVSSCPYEVSQGSEGPTKLLTAGGAGEGEGNASVLGWVQEKRFGASFLSLLKLSSASCCGAFSTHHFVLGDSLTPNLPLEILDVVDSRATFNFISSGKTFGVCLMLLIPGSLVDSAFCRWGLGTRTSFSFSSDETHE